MDAVGENVKVPVLVKVWDRVLVGVGVIVGVEVGTLLVKVIWTDVLAPGDPARAAEAETSTVSGVSS